MVDLAELESDATTPDMFTRLAGETRVNPRRSTRWVMANMVTSLDGRTDVDGRTGSLGGPMDRPMFQAIRALADAIVVGHRTATIERYGPPRVPDALVAARIEAGLAEQPHLYVTTRSLDIDVHLPAWARPDLVSIVTDIAAPEPVERELRMAGLDVVRAGLVEHGPRALLDIVESRGHRMILTEGGPTLLDAMIADDLVDELALTLSPRIVGTGAPLSSDVAADHGRWSVDRCWMGEGDCFLRLLAPAVPGAAVQ